MGIRSRSGSDRLRTVWTPEMDRYFIDLMLEQVNKGNKFDDHLFSKRAWKHMTSLFNAKFKFQYEKDVLKNRHKTLRNLYKAVKNLLDQRGFSWDETRQMVTAENNVWDEYIKVHLVFMILNNMICSSSFFSSLNKCRKLWSRIAGTPRCSFIQNKNHSVL